MQPTEYIFRTFLIESTSEKNAVYLTKFAWPLYSFTASHAVEYGSRIYRRGSRDKFRIDPAAMTQTLEIFSEVIAEHVESLKVVRKPSDFVSYASWRTGSRDIRVRTDFALTHYLIGNQKIAAEQLRQIEIDTKALDPVLREHYLPAVTRINRELDTNPSGLRPLLDEWRNAHIESLGVEKAVAAEKPPLRLVES